ncbi:MAG: SRPBCC family protein, partial [Planctomycetota bacterium]
LRLVDVADPKCPRPFQTALDYRLEGREDKTVLRLVHSGFPADARWDDLFDATRRGWHFELQALRHYLQHHRGEHRAHAWLRLACVEDPAVIWERLLGRRGLCTKGNLTGTQPGDSYAIETAAGDLFDGTVMIHAPPADLALEVVNMNRSLVRLKLDPAWDGSGRIEVNLFLSAFGIHHDDIEIFHARWRHQLLEIFPDAEELPAPAFAC